MKSKKRSKLLHALAAASILCVGVLFLTFAMSSNNAANRDFIAYWSAGKQLLHHANPYDSQAVLAIEKGAGLSDAKPLIMRNPPIAFPMVIALGLLSVRVGAILWSLLISAALMVSIRFIWKMSGSHADSLHLVGYMFPPALACLLAGQIGIFLLFGMTMFLYLHETRPYLAGASLLICAMKPHLFIPFGVILLLWSVANKTYKVLIGVSAALGVSFLFSCLIDPRGWSQYQQVANGIQDLFIPTLSLCFRLLLHRNWLWLQLVPALLGTKWAVRFFWDRRDEWDWREQGMHILLVSVMVAPYAWFTDEAVLLPAILSGLYVASDAGKSLLSFVFFTGIALLEVFAGIPMTTGFYLWTTPVWLMWYLWALRPLINLHEREAEVITL